MFSGGQNVYSCCDNLLHLLATLSHVFYCHLSLQRGDKNAPHPACISWLLLVSHGKFNGQSYCLLLDEFKVLTISSPLIKSSTI